MLEPPPSFLSSRDGARKIASAVKQARITAAVEARVIIQCSDIRSKALPRPRLADVTFSTQAAPVASGRLGL
jgi:hypothetical protein